MRRSLRLVLVATAFALATLSITTAVAAPVAWQSVDVTLHSEQAGSVLMVSGELPQSAQLPAEAQLSVPAGSKLQWIGEILGGDPSADPELKYTKTTTKGADVYRFTLTKSRTAQVEVPTPGTLFDGTAYTPSIKWVSMQDVPVVKLSVRTPQGAQVTKTAPGASAQPGPTGFSYYTKTVKDVKAGDPLELAFSYTAPAAGAASTGAASAGSSSDTLTIVLVVVVLLGAVGFLIYKMKSTTGALTEDSEESQPEQSKAAAQGKAAARKTTTTTSPKKQPAQTGDDEARPAKKVNMAVVTVAVVGALLIGVVIAGGSGTSARVTGGTIKKSFGAASPCTSASIAVVANQGVDLATDGEKLVDAFIGKEGIGDVTLDIGRSTVDIAFCESSQTQDSIRQILAGTGLVTIGGATPAASVPATASLAPSGKKQTASVDTASGNFSPSTITLKAGVPAEIAFGQASGCLSEVVFSELNVKQDLTAGPATVKLPALKAGTYSFACGMGHQGGQLVVQ